MAAIGTEALDRSLEWGELDGGVLQGEVSVKVASVEGVNCPVLKLHVLLRHRLPPFLGKPFGGCTASSCREIGYSASGLFLLDSEPSPRRSSARGRGSAKWSRLDPLQLVL
jgi:hypothetical protein